MHLGHFAFFVIYLIGNVRHGGDDLHVELAAQAFLHNLHVKQSQETATETESQGYRGLGRERQCCIVELQFLERGTQVLKVLRIYRINAGKHHRFHFLETLDRAITRALHMGDGIAHAHLGRILDTRNDVTHIAGR